MKRIGKIIIFSVLGLVLLLVGVVAALPWLIDPNDYKPEIQALAREKAGVELNLKGGIAWRLFPQPALQLQQVSVASLDAPPAAAKPLAALDSLSLSVRLRPLLSRQIQISDFRANGLKLALDGVSPVFSARGELLYDAPTQTLEGNHLQLTLDDSRFTGRLVWREPGTPSNMLSLQLEGDRLDIDRYLPQDPAAGAHGTAAAARPPSSSGQMVWRDTPILPLEPLQKLNFQLEVAIGQLIVKQLPLENVRLQVNNQDGVLTVQNLQGSLNGGSLVAQGDLTASPKTNPKQPLLNAKLKLSNLPLEKLLMAGKAPINGKLSMDVALRTRGNSQKDWISNLSGNVHWTLKEGVIRELSLERYTCQAISLLNRQRLGSAVSPDTAFKQISGNFHITRGVADNPDLLIQLVGLNVNGEGQIDLRSMNMNYRLGVLITGDTRPSRDPACTIHPGYAGLTLPIRCQGTLQSAASSCGLDTAGINNIAQRLVNQTLSETRNQTRALEKQLEQRLNEGKRELQETFRRGLFGR